MILELTGIQMKLPSARSDFAFYSQILAPWSISAYLNCGIKLMQATFPHDTQTNAFTVECAIRDYSTIEERYIEGTLSVSMKRDLFHLPFLGVGVFLPKNVTVPFFPKIE